MTDRTSTRAGAPRAGADSECDEPSGGDAADGLVGTSHVCAPSARRFTLHGPSVDVECRVPSLDAQIEAMLAPSAGVKAPARVGLSPVSGTVLPYDVEEVLRSVSPTAGRLPPQSGATELTEVYEEGERYWLVDERWGLAEINLLKGQWRSWVLPEGAVKLDAVRCGERAVLWPLAQLVRGRGVHLLPAAAAVRDGWAVLILCPFSLEPELRAIMAAGYRIIGQRWVAVREEEGRLALLHMPGRVERPGAQRSHAQTAAGGAGEDEAWVDLTAGQGWARQEHAFCDAVLVAEPGRRGCAEARELKPSEAAAHLRRAWPLPDLHPAGRPSQLPVQLARHCCCARAQLSRDPKEIIDLLSAMREGPVRMDWTEAWQGSRGPSAGGVYQPALRGRAA